MDPSALSRLIYKAFKARGLSISGDGSKALISVLSREEDVEGSLKLILDELKERIEKQDVRSNIIDVATIEKIVLDLSSTEEDVAQESVELFDAFNYPKLCYDEKMKSFKVESSPSYTLLGDVNSRTNMYRERLLLAQNRLLRSDMFTLRGLQSKSTKNNEDDVYELSTIESLLGSEGVKVLYGMLTQVEEGHWFLEDLGSTIRLDFSRARSFNRFYTEGSIVVVEGILAGKDLFQVHEIGFPPAETRTETLRSLGISDVFGAGFRPQHLIEMQEMEEAAEHHFVVILSEVHLDKPHVVAKLKKIFAAYEENELEPLYLFIGSFFSKPLFRVNNGKDTMKQAFHMLADLIAEFPRQREMAKFIFVPGPCDGGSNVVVPRRGVSPQLVQPLKDCLQHVAFASNPCKVRCFTQEIVVFREDMLRKMQKHLAIPLVLDESSPDITEQMIISLLDQAHLCPLPLHARPIQWELDYVMRLFPLPHLLILADRTEHFSYEYKGCMAVNPGSFSQDFSFIVYQPSSKSVQYSRVSE